MSANYLPNLNTYTDLKPFRFWCQKVLPLAYDDSLSYYELLNKVVDYLNKTMEDVTLSIEDVQKLHTAYEQLETYVNDYFDNLDVQEEINTKLDSLVEDGTIHDIFNPDVEAILSVANQAASDAIEAIPSNVTAWLDTHVTPETEILLDESLTIEGAAADAKAAGDQIRALKSDLSDANNAVSVLYNGDNEINPEWEQGSINASGGNVSVSYRMRTPGLYPYEERIYLKNVPSNILIQVVLYKSDSSVVLSTWFDENTPIAISADTKYFRLVARFTPEDTTATMAQTDVESIRFYFPNYVLTELENIKDEIDAIPVLQEYMNSKNYMPVTFSPITRGGITVSGHENYISLDGDFEGESAVYFDLYSGPNTLADDEYYISFSSNGLNYDGFLTIYYDTGSGLVNYKDNIIGQQKIIVDSSVQTIVVRYFIRPHGQKFNNKKIYFSLANEPSNKSLKLKGVVCKFLNAFGTGDCTIIKFDNGETLVIDFGLNEPQETLLRSWNAAITELGITHIDYAIISHYHADHVGMLLYGIDSLIDENTTFFLPGGHAYTQTELDALAWVDSMSGDQIVNNYNAVMQVLAFNGCILVYPAENDKWVIGNCEVQFWNADQQYIMDQFIAHTMYDYNNASLCNYITIGAYRLCFSGDIGVPVMDHYKTSVLQSQIFKVNHHSMGYTEVPLFMNSLMPDVGVTMVGYNLAIARLGSEPIQDWFEDNNVPNVVTGINQKTLSLFVTEGGYHWTTACRKLICADEGITS